MGSGSAATASSEWTLRKLSWSSRQDATFSGRDIEVPQAAATVETGPLHVFLGGAPWARIVVSRLERLATLEKNWDAEGAASPSSAAFLESLDLLADLMERDTPPPAIVPTSQGGLSLEWHSGTQSIEVEVPSRGAPTVYFRDSTTAEEWDDCKLSQVRSRVRYLLGHLNDRQH